MNIAANRGVWILAMLGAALAGGVLALLVKSAATDTRPAALPAAAAAHFYPAPFRRDVVEIVMPPGPDLGSELEYKVRMRTGGALIYSWEAGAAKPDEFYFDFHSETDPAPGQKEGTSVTHKKGMAVGGNGLLIAPFDGIHGWFFQNSAAGPVTVRLHLAGFYSLVPPTPDLIPIPGNIRVLSN